MQLINTISQVPAWHLSFASMDVNVSWLPSGNLHLHLRTRHTKNNEASRMCHITLLYAKGVFCVCSHNEPLETSFRTKTCIADSNGENELQYSPACRDSASFSGLLFVQPRLVSPVWMGAWVETLIIRAGNNCKRVSLLLWGLAAWVLGHYLSVEKARGLWIVWNSEWWNRYHASSSVRTVFLSFPSKKLSFEKPPLQPSRSAPALWASSFLQMDPWPESHRTLYTAVFIVYPLIHSWGRGESNKRQYVEGDIFCVRFL